MSPWSSKRVAEAPAITVISRPDAQVIDALEEDKFKDLSLGEEWMML